jgi:cytochrome P450
MFDHHSRDYADNWRELFSTAHRSCPVILSDHYGGYYVLTRHADVLAAGADAKHLSSSRSFDDQGADVGLGVSIPPRPQRLGFLEMDPPDSLKYRRLLNKWFTRSATDRGRARIREIATWAIDEVIEDGACDAVEDLIVPYQRALLLDVLGLPMNRWMDYRSRLEGEIHDHTGGTDDGSLRQVRRGQFYDWLRSHIADEVRAQREQGGVGLIAGLVATQVDGAPISLEMATELLVMIFGGGEDTTVGTIASALLHLSDHPDQQQLLLDQPDLLPMAIDEILRYYAPGSGMARTVIEPVTIGGQDFQPGDRVLLAYAGANMDSSVFHDPEQVDLTRSPNPHLSFGTGAHRCIGALLAHASAECFVSEFVRRAREYTVDRTALRPAYADIGSFNSYYSMPVRYAPGTRTRPHADVPLLTADRILPSEALPTPQ